MSKQKGFPKKILFCYEPGRWPIPPERFSYSNLFEIESCPLRWALSNADYPTIWSEQGYPKKPSVPALTGSIVHRAIELLTKELVEIGCESFKDIRVIKVLKNKGGWAGILTKAMDEILRREKNNPRLTTSEYVTLQEKVFLKIPRMRYELQSLVSRIKLIPRIRKDDHSKTSKMLGIGTYSEIRLEISDFNFVGKIDSLTVTSNGCEITDFKTGDPKPEHEFQIRLYALLWAFDKHHNPYGRIANELHISYDALDCKIKAPSITDLNKLKLELQQRVICAKENISNGKPTAKPSEDICHYCMVRHLCSEYWKPETLKIFANTAKHSNALVDIQAKIKQRHGPHSWDAITESGIAVEPGEKLLIRENTGDELLEYSKSAELSIRILNSRLVNPDSDNETEPNVVYLGYNSEIFILSK